MKIVVAQIWHNHSSGNQIMKHCFVVLLLAWLVGQVSLMKDNDVKHERRKLFPLLKGQVYYVSLWPTNDFVGRKKTSYKQFCRSQKNCSKTSQPSKPSLKLRFDAWAELFVKHACQQRPLENLLTKRRSYVILMIISCHTNNLKSQFCVCLCGGVAKNGGRHLICRTHIVQWVRSGSNDYRVKVSIY